MYIIYIYTHLCVYLSEIGISNAYVCIFLVGSKHWPNPRHIVRAQLVLLKRESPRSLAVHNETRRETIVERIDFSRQLEST